MKSILWPQPKDLLGGFNSQAAVNAFVEAWKPDIVCTYGLDALAASASLKRPVVRVASIVELDHLVRRYRRDNKVAGMGLSGVRRQVVQLRERRLASVIVDLLKPCDVVIDHAAHHCQWLRQHGVPHATYFPVLVLDKTGRSAPPPSKRLPKKPSLLLLGKVTGTATVPGLYLFADEMLPALEDALGVDGVEAHIVGGGRLQAPLQAALDRPSVRIRGYVDDIVQEFISHEVVLVPAPIELGFRTRIAEAFSYGCCVVCHEANVQGMPELNHGVNCLVGADAAEMVHHILACFKQPELRARLGREARLTFERSLDGQKVGEHIVELVESVAV